MYNGDNGDGGEIANKHDKPEQSSVTAARSDVHRSLQLSALPMYFLFLSSCSFFYSCSIAHSFVLITAWCYASVEYAMAPILMTLSDLECHFNRF